MRIFLIYLSSKLSYTFPNFLGEHLNDKCTILQLQEVKTNIIADNTNLKLQQNYLAVKSNQCWHDTTLSGTFLIVLALAFIGLNMNLQFCTAERYKVYKLQKNAMCI